MLKQWKKRLLCGLTALTFAAAGVGVPAVGETGLDFNILAAAADIVDSGICGENVAWALDDAGTLTFTGEGAMDNFVIGFAPWYAKKLDIKNVIIGDGITGIGNWAFALCSNLESADIPGSVTSIGEWAFGGCASLTSIAIPGGITEIPDNAFNSCEKLSEVTIPNTVTSIGEAAFYGCGSLETIAIPDSVTSIGDMAFSLCAGLKSIVIPNGVTTISENTFSECASLTSVTIPESVTSIDAWAFHECESLAEITIPKSVESIEARAFLSCPNLKSVTVPKSVKSIGEQALGYSQDKENGSVNKTEGFKIYCYKDTAAHKYATENEIDYELLDADMVISPKLKLSEGEAAPDCTAVIVTAFNAAGGIAAEVNADADGNIDLGDLPEGEYTLKIQLAGFAPRSISYTAGDKLGEIALCKYGDCNGDGAIDFFDLGLMQRKLCNWNVDYVYPETADTNGDGSYSTMDLGALQRYLCNWGNTLGIVS